MDKATNAPGGRPHVRARGDPPLKRPTRKATKRDRLMYWLSRPKGATVREIARAFGWANHSVRALISTEVKRAGHRLDSEWVPGRGRVYHVH